MSDLTMTCRSYDNYGGPVDFSVNGKTVFLAQFACHGSAGLEVAEEMFYRIADALGVEVEYKEGLEEDERSEGCSVNEQ